MLMNLGESLILIIIGLWATAWKGYSLWLSARSGQKKWFLVLLIINTIGILEIYYIFKVQNKKISDIKRVLRTKIF
jgi:hypothetical protein